jgi:hypothetical protein
MTTDLDFGMLDLDSRTAEPDDAPSVVISTPIVDQYGSRYAAPRDASRLLGLATRDVERQLAGRMAAVGGFRFSFL